MSDSPKGNDRRKNRLWHITYKGHYMLPVPSDGDLFYCFEMGEQHNTEHTHCGWRASVAICKRDLLSYLCEHLEVECEPDVRSHQNWKTIVGYHYGKGDKAACSNVQWVAGEPDRKDIYFPKRHYIAEQNKTLLATNVKDAIDGGLIHLFRARNLKEAQDLYRRQRTKPILNVGDSIASTWGAFNFVFRDTKRRHYWFFSRGSNRGKTTNVRRLKDYAYAESDHRNQWWTCEPGFQWVVLDAFRPFHLDGDSKRYTMPWGELEKLCDGDFLFNIKCEPVLRGDQNYVCFIASNLSPEEAYEEAVQPYIKTRFLVYEILDDGTLSNFYD